MKVVYTPDHLAHDPVVETYLGETIPANEVADRAERIRGALEADGGFDLVAPNEHGTEPILAVHDPGLVRFLDDAWQEHRRQGVARTFLTADTYPTFRMFEGMSPEAIAAIPEPTAVGGRAGGGLGDVREGGVPLHARHAAYI